MNPGPSNEQQNEQMENNLKLVQAKIELHERRLKAHKARGKAIHRLLSTIALGPEGKAALAAFLPVDAEWYDAEAQLFNMAIAELKGSAMLIQAAIDHNRKQKRILN